MYVSSGLPLITIEQPITKPRVVEMVQLLENRLFLIQILDNLTHSKNMNKERPKLYIFKDRIVLFLGIMDALAIQLMSD